MLVDPSLGSCVGPLDGCFSYTQGVPWQLSIFGGTVIVAANGVYFW
jgi:hypothetical protein